MRLWWRYLTEKYGEPKGTVLEITGNMAQNVAQLRGGGFQDDGQRQNEGIDLITKIGDWEAENGVDIVRDVVPRPRMLDAIYFHSDCVYTPGTLQVLERARQARPALARMAISSWPAWMPACRHWTPSVPDTSDQASNQPIPDFGVVAVEFLERELAGETIEPQTLEQEGDALVAGPHRGQ